MTDEKTYTLPELIGNARRALDNGELTQQEALASGAIVAALLGYPITEEGYARFDADLTAAGL